MLDKPVPIMIYTPCWSGFCSVGGDSFGNICLLPGQFFNKFLLESLILAQDERWRRA